LERFVAVLIEHCEGNFPLWLTPDQATILPISDHYNEYAKKVLQLLINADIRGLLDIRDEKIGKKIRDAEMKKVPYMLIIGEKEHAENRVSVRKHGSGDLGSQTLTEFIQLINNEISEALNVN